MIKGVDLSANQTDIDWGKAHRSIEYAILRATTKNNKADLQFMAHQAGCKIYGIPFDVYKYMYATEQNEASAEIKSVLNLLKDTYT